VITILSNLIDIEKDLSNIDQKFRIGVSNGLKSVGERFNRATRLGIKNSPKSHRPYTYSARGRRFRTMSSKPGSYPAEQTGKLRNSIDYEFVGKMKIVAGSYADYSVFLENGTKKMAARPIIKKTNELNEAKFNTMMTNEMNEALGL